MNRWLGLALLIVTVFVFSGCCARLQSPVVFDTCYNNCGWGGGGNVCGNPCDTGCNPCSPCNPGYAQ